MLTKRAEDDDKSSFLLFFSSLPSRRYLLHSDAVFPPQSFSSSEQKKKKLSPNELEKAMKNLRASSSRIAKRKTLSRKPTGQLYKDNWQDQNNNN